MMASPEQLFGLATMFHAARVSGHIFPDAAASEWAVETAWGTSKLFLLANNVFGSKTPRYPLYPSITMNTQEQDADGIYHTILASFVHYPTAAESFEDRMATLNRLAPTYPHYAAALASLTPEDFLINVSMSWATARNRAANCIAILHAHRDLFTAEVTA